MLKVLKRGSKNLPGTESLFVSFQYNASTVAKIKTMETRRYDGDTKSWEIPCEDIQKLIELFGKNNLYIGKGVELNPKVEKASGVDYSKNENKLRAFDKYLCNIQTEEVAQLAHACVQRLPEYFFHAPASSSGKYHPKYALGDGGLLRHTQSAMLIAITLFGNDTVQQFSQLEKDCIIVALCLHDGYKQGDNAGHTTFNHPIAVVEYLESELPKLVNNPYWEAIKEGIVSHMGQWNTSKYEDTVLPLPTTSIQRFVHLCDYLASRKFLNVDLL